MSMVNPRFIEEVAKTEGLSKAETQRVVRTVLSQITNALTTKGSFSLPDIGTLKVVKRAARTGRNPQTGDPVAVPERWDLKIKPAPEIRRRLNSGLQPNP